MIANKMWKVLFGLGVSAAALVAAGCESSNASRAARSGTPGPADQAVTCDKCKVTWVNEPITSGGGKEHVIAYQSRKSMECPDCRTEVDNFFRTGRLEHTCKTCGDSMEVCEAH